MWNYSMFLNILSLNGGEKMVGGTLFCIHKMDFTHPAIISPCLFYDKHHKRLCSLWLPDSCFLWTVFKHWNGTNDTRFMYRLQENHFQKWPFFGSQPLITSKWAIHIHAAVNNTRQWLDSLILSTIKKLDMSSFEDMCTNDREKQRLPWLVAVDLYKLIQYTW